MSSHPPNINTNSQLGNGSQQNSSATSTYVARVAEYRRLYQSFHIDRRISMGTSPTAGVVRWPYSDGNVSSDDPGMVLYGRVRMLQGANLEATKNEVEWFQARVGAFAYVDNSQITKVKAAMAKIGTMWRDKCRNVYDADPESPRITSNQLQRSINEIWAELYIAAEHLMWLEEMFKQA